jgi:hypothetical protein
VCFYAQKLGGKKPFMELVTDFLVRKPRLNALFAAIKREVRTVVHQLNKLLSCINLSELEAPRIKKRLKKKLKIE